LLRTSLKRFLLFAIAGAAGWIAAGCSGSVAPGYTIEKQRIEVTYTMTVPDRVSVRAWYRMRNTGSEPLGEIHFRLPYKDKTENMRAEWGNKSLVAQSVAGTEVEFSTRFGAPWNQKDRKELTLIYDLKIMNATISLGEGRGPVFFLPTGGWYPYLLAPAATLSQGGTPPAKWDLVVSVPQGYLAHASGTQRGQDRSEARDKAGSSYRFEQKPATDFDPFVVAGPFIEQQEHFGSETVFLWTTKPMSVMHAQEFGERLGEEEAYFTKEFGLKDTVKGQVWRIGCPEGAPVLDGEPGRFPAGGSKSHWGSPGDCITVPLGAIRPIAIDYSSVPDLFVAPYHIDFSGTQYHLPFEDVQLAGTWFPFAVHDAPDGPWFPMSGTPDYIALSFTMSKNPSKRVDYIHQLIGSVDSDPEGVKENLESAKSIETARIRSELFYLALEDRCGEANVHRALARIVRDLRGQTWGVSDLRSAMEAECGGDLADFFREWLLRPGIPDSFRARYMSAPGAKPAREDK
jgi:hypothetical protein